MARTCCSNWLGVGALDRPVAGVVDARRQLVDREGAVAQHEELHGDDADDVEGRRDPGADRRCRAGNASREVRGRDGFDQDSGVVAVAHDGYAASVPSRARAVMIETSAAKSSSRSTRSGTPAGGPAVGWRPGSPRERRSAPGPVRRSRRWAPSVAGVYRARPRPHAGRPRRRSRATVRSGARASRGSGAPRAGPASCAGRARRGGPGRRRTRRRRRAPRRRAPARTSRRPRPGPARRQPSTES